MQNEYSGANIGCPTDSGKADPNEGRESTSSGAVEDEKSPREDAAEKTRGCAGRGPRHQDGTNSSGEKAPVLTDGGFRQVREADVQEIAADLTKFQVRQLATVADQDQYGIGIQRELEEYYGEEINHGRNYPNLDELVELGLLEKSKRDDRTNNYSISSLGERVLEYELEWLSERINGGGDE